MLAVLTVVVVGLLGTAQPAAAVSSPLADSAQAAPTNDMFANGQVISGSEGSATGTTVDATAEPGEPAHAGQEGGLSVWYRWTAPKSQALNLGVATTNGSLSFLAVYTGSSLAALTPVASDANRSSVTFSATAGTQYRIAVVAYDWSQGEFSLRWNEPPANDLFANGRVISGREGSVTGTTVGATAEPGEPAHGGGEAGFSVWHRWTAPTSQTLHLELAATTNDWGPRLAVYTGSSVTALTPVQGDAHSSSVLFPVRAGTQYHIVVDAHSWGQGPFSLTWKMPPANDDFADGQVITGSSGSLTTSNALATNQTGEPRHAGFDGGSSTWYRWSPPLAGAARLNTFGTDFDTMLAVYTGSSLNALTVVAADDDANGTGNSALAFWATPGVVYRIAVDGYQATTGTVKLAWSQPPVPTVAVTAPNGGETVAPGSTRSVTWTYAPAPASAAAAEAPAAAAEAPASTEPAAAEPAASTSPSEADLETVASVAQAEGKVRVIVGLNAGFRPESRLSKAQVAAQRQGITAARGRVVERLKGTQHRVTRTFETVPSVALELSAASVERLRGAAEVASVVEDELSAPTLVDSTPQVEAPLAWGTGFDGAGQVVAVLDSGVQANHPFLAGKVVEEACYSAQSSCPNGSTSQTGPGAGAPCNYASICDHGTHVAGIVAGANATSAGVARGAQIMAVQVFSRFTGFVNCGNGLWDPDPCAKTLVSDQMAGLERVYSLRTTRSFAAVNMSLGGGRHNANCDTDPRKALIDQLRAAGIPTIISSGNSGFTDSMIAPACISTAVSVGSTTKADVVSSTSNSVSFLSLLAPGHDITSSTTGGGFVSKNGTSQAAPHVAGAWAVLKQYQPSATVDAVLAALQSTGLPVKDSRNDVVKPRIQVHGALLALPPRVDVHLLKAGAVVATIAKDVPATAGSVSWSVPAGLAAGSDYRVRVTSVSDPRATDTSNASFTVGASPAPKKAVADFDGNGTSDVAVYRPSTGVWYVQSPFNAVKWGEPGDVPVPGDYDGNGSAEQAVYRPSTGVWYLYGPPFRATKWGEDGDVPVPGDYDGNGSTDVAVYRPSTGVWYVQSPFKAVKWGEPGDIPVPGDYDGNGSVEAAVYRPSTGVWYLYGPPFRATKWGEAGDTPLGLPQAVYRRFF